jgi:1,4-dihydroxy-2-naphthoyl-CoA hydrolase
VLAVPVAPPSADTAMRGDADEVICLEMPERFLAIGEWYEDFAQTSDEEVVALLRAARAGPGAPAAGTGPGFDGGARAGYGLVPGALAEQADGSQEEQVRESQVDRPRAPAPGHAAGGPGQVGHAAGGPGEAGHAAGGPGQAGHAAGGPGEAGHAAGGPGQAGHAAGGPGEAGHAADGPGEAGHAADGTGPAAGGDLAGLLAMMPFAAGLGIVLDAATVGEVRGRLAWAPERCTSGGILHGGVLMALADSLGGICAFLNLPPGALTATTSSATVFTRAVRSGEVTAVTRPLHVGRTVIVVQTDMTDVAGRRVAQVTQTQAVLGRPA